MGKKKDNLEALRRDDPKENNWEIEEKSEPVTPKPEEKVLKCPEELKEYFSKLDGNEDDRVRLEAAIVLLWERIDPEVRSNNPVTYFSNNPGKKEAVFLFRSGQKVRVKY